MAVSGQGMVEKGRVPLCFTITASVTCIDYVSHETCHTTIHRILRSFFAQKSRFLGGNIHIYNGEERVSEKIRCVTLPQRASGDKGYFTVRYFTVRYGNLLWYGTVIRLGGGNGRRGRITC